MIETEPLAATQDGRTNQVEVIAFCCNFCAYAAADLAGARRMQYPANVRIVHVPCTGKVEVKHLLAAFERGIDGILLAGCLEGGCHFVEGNLRAKRRVEAAKQVLDEIGLGRDRLRMVNLSASEAPTFVARIQEMVETVSALGPNPLRLPGEKEHAR
jgi:F420-non-reducing hydrogenase iron-sulfur subunit